MSNCPNCTLPLENSSRFCGVCGARQTESDDISLPKTLLSAAPPPEAAMIGIFDDEPAAKQAPRAASEHDSSRAASEHDSGRVLSEHDSTRAASEHDSVQAVPDDPEKEPELFDPSDPAVGMTLNGRYVVQSKIGEGGFGAVYRGVQKGTNRVVAIKLLHPEMTRDKNVVERFRREGNVLCRLKDAHTVTTYDFDQTPDGTLFMAMELLEGNSLHDLFAQEAPIGWRRMLKIISEMCSSLAEAHAMGIVHRDLKPENVHLEKRSGNDDFVKILDFGIAKMLRGDGNSPNSPQLTAMGQTLGTLEYMSPEQLMGKTLDGRSDVYAMGVLAHELITGQLPFPEAIGPALLITSQLKSTPPAMSSIRPDNGIPPEVDALVLKMLGKLVEDRFDDVDCLRQECLRILKDHTLGRAVVQTPPVQAPLAFQEQEQAQAQPQRMQTNPGMATRSPWVWVAVAAIVLSGGVALYIL